MSLERASLDLLSPTFVSTDQQEFKFTRIELRKTETLGSGSYGAVCIAKCDELLCAAKLLFTVLFDMDDGNPLSRSPKVKKPHRIPMRRFEQECRFLSQIKHPNIVQYLGTYRDPDSRALVLLMELMDENLTNFLARLSISLPYYMQVGISHDVAMALAYLHSNNIIHRDLSSNNVLLLHGCRAKVSDFGMSTLAVSPGGNSQTICPGTPVYMPPEAMNEPPRYSEMLDSFSFGVLLVQIMSQEFPSPTDRFTTMEVQDPRQPNSFTEAKFAVSEKVRRKDHIDMIDENQPLLPIAMLCLSDGDQERPSASVLCSRIEALKATRQYTESNEERLDLERVETKIRDIRQEYQRRHREEVEELREQLENAEQELQSSDQLLRIRTNHLSKLSHELSLKEEECKSLRCAVSHDVELQEKERALERIIEQKERQMKRLQQQIDLQDQTVRDLRSVIQRHEQDIDELQMQLARESERCSLLLQKLSQAEQSRSSSKSSDGKANRVDEDETDDYDHQDTIITLRHQHHLETKSKEVLDLRRDLSMKDSLIQDLQRQLKQLEKGREDEQVKIPQIRDNLSLGLKRGPRAPSRIYGGSATSLGSKAYFRPSDSSEIYEFCTDSGEWNQLLSCTSRSSTLVVIENLLTIIGGSHCLSLRLNKWKSIHPPLHYGRYNSTAINCGGYLVVAGGIGENGRSLPSVEVLKLDTKQWITCSSLPFPIYSASGVAINDTLYLLGGFSKPSDGPVCSVLTCSLKALVSSGMSSTRSSSWHPGDYSSLPASVWHRLADLPFSGATCVTAHDHLFAIGGRDKHNAQNSIYTFDFAKNSWKSLSRLKSARSDCLVSVVSTDSKSKLIIVGGYTDNGLSDSIEIANIYI